MAEHKSPAECRRAAHVADLVAIVKDDWPAFWRSLPPREQWEAAKAMPKIAGPWQRDADGYWIREDPACGGGAYAARQPFDGRASADAALREAGWVLCDDETEEGGRG